MTKRSIGQEDEQQIRQLVSQWLAASQSGDVDTILELMSDDVVFLVVGRPPMGKQEFAALSRPQLGQTAPKIESTSEIQELVVSGEWAFMRTAQSVLVTPPESGETIRRAGHTLTVFRKINGKWLLARDANLSTLQPASL